jgi:hypothetical protein
MGRSLSNIRMRAHWQLVVACFLPLILACELKAVSTNYQRLADQVKSVGGVAEQVNNGVLVDLDKGEHQIHVLDAKAFTAIMDGIAATGLPCHLKLDSHDLGVAECEAIGRCKEIVTLDLIYAKFAPSALPQLARLKKLNRLLLVSAQVPAEDLGFLGNMKSLTHLDLANTSTTDDTVSRLTNIPNLAYLYLNKTKVTDESMKRLGKIATLNEIGIGSLPITDEGLLALSTFKHLLSLDIGGTRITPQGIEEFLKGTSVDLLFIDRVLLKDPKIKELQKKYPKTTIQ